MSHTKRTTIGKALEINQSDEIYGAFAEIGAGQEVARYFFQAGQASKTIAKTISAYDMIYSDEIYGKEESGRYVCDSRVSKMLEKEFRLLQKRLDSIRGDKTTFFAYANTVATAEIGGKRQPHGWMGIRFQTKPKGPSNDIVLHVRLHDKYRLQQQEVLGILGVNLVSAAFKNLSDHADFIPSLVENIREGQLYIDTIRFSGPDVKDFNNHLMNLELVRRGLAEAVLFGPDQSILTISDAVWGRPLIVERGAFKPITNSHLDLLSRGIENFTKEFPKEKDPLVLFEMTMYDLLTQNSEKPTSSGQLDEKDFLDRVKSLSSLGHYVLVSNFFRFYSLKKYLRSYSQKPISMIIGANLLEKIFDENRYSDLDGGMLEALGTLFDKNTRLFVYPNKTTSSCSTAALFKPKENQNIYKHFIENKLILDMANCDEISEFIVSDQVLHMIQAKNPEWEHLVPKVVKDLIKRENLFGYKD